MCFLFMNESKTLLTLALTRSLKLTKQVHNNDGKLFNVSHAYTFTSNVGGTVLGVCGTSGTQASLMAHGSPYLAIHVNITLLIHPQHL